MNISELCNEISKTESVVVNLPGIVGDLNKFQSFVEMYFDKQEKGFTYKVADICNALSVEDDLKRTYLSIGLVQLSGPCKKCGELDAWVQTASRSNTYFDEICLSCGHKNTPNCQCQRCSDERLESNLNLFKSYLPVLLSERKKLYKEELGYDELCLSTLLELLKRVNDAFLLDARGRINLHEMKELAAFGLCPPPFEPDEEFSERICRYAENKDALDLIQHDPVQFLLWESRTVVPKYMLSMIIESLVRRFDSGEFSPSEIQSCFGGEREVLREFTVKFAKKMGVDLSDIKDITIDNLEKLLEIMPLGKALYAIKNSVKAAYSYSIEVKANSIVMRNLCVNYLNKLHTRYVESGGTWQVPMFEVEDWRLAEEYGIEVGLSSLKDFILKTLDAEVEIYQKIEKIAGKIIEG